MFLDKHNVTHWIVPFALAIILRLITHKYHHQLIFPLCTSIDPFPPDGVLIVFLDILVVFVAFYVVVVVARFDLGCLRAQGWVFDMGTASQEWYTFYTYFRCVPPPFLIFLLIDSRVDFKAVHFGPLLSTMPTQLAL